MHLPRTAGWLSCASAPPSVGGDWPQAARRRTFPGRKAGPRAPSPWVPPAETAFRRLVLEPSDPESSVFRRDSADLQGVTWVVSRRPASRKGDRSRQRYRPTRGRSSPAAVVDPRPGEREGEDGPARSWCRGRESWSHGGVGDAPLPRTVGLTGRRGREHRRRGVSAKATRGEGGRSYWSACRSGTPCCSASARAARGEGGDGGEPTVAAGHGAGPLAGVPTASSVHGQHPRLISRGSSEKWVPCPPRDRPPARNSGKGARTALRGRLLAAGG